MITPYIFLEGKDYFASYYFHKILYFKLKKKNLHLVVEMLILKRIRLKVRKRVHIQQLQGELLHLRQDNQI